MNKNDKEISKKYEKNSLKNKKKPKNSAFKANYFSYYNDIKTNPKQDW